MKRDIDILSFINILHNIGYTGDRIRERARGKSIGNEVPKRIARIEAEDSVECDDSQGKEMKNLLPFNQSDIWTKLEVLRELELSGHTDTLTRASNVTDELYETTEGQNEL